MYRSMHFAIHVPLNALQCICTVFSISDVLSIQLERLLCHFEAFTRNSLYCDDNETLTIEKTENMTLTV